MLDSWKMAGLLTLCVPLFACGSPDASAPEASAPHSTGLTLQLAETVQWTPVSAQVATLDEAQILARIPGILTALTVREGDYVRKGQVIGRIVDSSLGYQIGAYGAQAAAAQAQAVEADAELARTRYLYDNGVYAKARLEQAQAAAGAARAQVSAALEQQKAVRAVAGQGVVLAPANGRVLTADIPVGAPVAPGMTIAAITSGAVVLRLELPESLAGSVHAGSEVVVDDDGRELHGTIARIYPSVRSGQVQADTELTGLDASLIGRRMQARIESGRRKALLIPQRYITTRYGIDYVTLRTQDGAASSVPVQTAPVGEKGMVEVLSGVSAGDVLVVGANR